MSLDLFINAQIANLQTEFLTKTMITTTNIMSIQGLTILSLLLLSFLLYKREYAKSLLTVLAIGGGIALELSLKTLIQRPRPDNTLIETASTYSFPSGHATLAIIFFSLLIYFFKDKIKNKILRYCFIAGNILLILLIGFSRVYLNAHWFTDILGAFILGIFWLYLLLFLKKKASQQRK